MDTSTSYPNNTGVTKSGGSHFGVCGNPVAAAFINDPQSEQVLSVPLASIPPIKTKGTFMVLSPMYGSGRCGTPRRSLTLFSYAPLLRYCLQ